MAAAKRSVDPPDFPGFTRGVFPGEGYFRCPVAADCTYPEARLLLEKFWRNRPADLTDWSIMGTAMRFEWKMENGAERVSQNHVRVFSGSYRNAAVALDAGFLGEAEL